MRSRILVVRELFHFTEWMRWSKINRCQVNSERRRIPERHPRSISNRCRACTWGRKQIYSSPGQIMQCYESFSAEETFNIGKMLARQAVPGQILALSGDLGVGKTVFTKGFAAGLGITDPVSSPTFTILQIYEGGRLPLYHFDVYRIEDPEEMEEVGLDEYLFGQGVCLIEWAEKIAEILPESTRIVRIRKDLIRGLDYRAIEVD